MKIAIHQPQYMPWLGYFHKMSSADLFVLLDDVQFKKNEWQHRNRIRTSTGCQWLSVPTSYKFPQKINEVAIDNSQDWRKTHRTSLETCYGKSRFGKEILPLFTAFFERSFTTIDQVSAESIVLLANMLGITTPIVRSSDFPCTTVSTERLVDLCKHYGAHVYLAGVGGRNYMDMPLFLNAGITVEFQDFHCPVYAQHWSKTADDFIPNLSAIDVVFNYGIESKSLLMRAG